jgi:hypothetical protein
VEDIIDFSEGILLLKIQKKNAQRNCLEGKIS